MPDYEKVAEVTADGSSSSISVTWSTTAYDHMEALISVRATATGVTADYSPGYVQFHNGTSWTGQHSGRHDGSHNTTTTGISQSFVNSTSFPVVDAPNGDTPTGVFGLCRFILPDVNKTDRYQSYMFENYSGSANAWSSSGSTAAPIILRGGGIWDQTSALKGININYSGSGGNVASGSTIIVYGMK
jgi:hypothetical protein